MKAIFKSRWLRVVGRYVLAPIVVGAVATMLESILGAAYPRTDIGFELFLLVPVSVLVAWIAVAVTDRIRLIWRVLLPWAPCAPLLVLLMVSMLRPRAPWDDTGFDLLLYGGVLRFAVVLAVIGSVVALVWGRGEGWVRPPQ